jgi:hypothetical protein
MPDSQHTQHGANHKEHKPSLDQRARSVPYKKKFVLAGIVALITSAVAFFYVTPEFKKRSAELIVASLGFCMLSWLIAYMKRRGTLCPLCKSTPFLDNLARKHDKAYRVKPFNYGTTAVLNAAVIQRWRCMYCGTSFDLLKTKSELK